MKKFTFYTMLLSMALFFSCTVDKIDSDPNSNLEPNFIVVDGKSASKAHERTSLNEPCMTTNLIAGQNMIAGTVSVDSDGQTLSITYTTTGNWTIDATHLSIGNCDEQWVPTTGSDNPKIGKFEHSQTHPDGTTVVTYYLDQSVLNENYCFAAHAEVSGSSNETAWAEGTDFGGNSWAMYVEALLSDCDVEGDGNGDVSYK